MTRVGDSRGQVLVLASVCMTVLMGVAMFSVDASRLYGRRTQLFAAADAAAKSAALELLRGNSTPSNLVTFAQKEVDAQLGAGSGATPTVTCSTTPTGTFAACASASRYLRVALSVPTATFFGWVMNRRTVTIGATATAGAASSTHCVVALGTPGGTSTNLSFSGSSDVDASGCSIAVQGNMTNSGPGSRMNVDAISVSGTTCSSCPSGYATTAPPPNNWLALLSAPPAGTTSSPSAHCTHYLATDSADASCTAGTYTDALNITSTSSRTKTWNFASGIYTLNLGLSATCSSGGSSRCPRINAPSSGSGVAMYIAGGWVSVANGSVLNLSAQTSGTYKGIAMFGFMSGSTVSFNNANSTSSSTPGFAVNGLLFFPAATMTLTGSSGGSRTFGDCLIMVAKTITMSSGSLNFGNACSDFSGSPWTTVSITQ